MAVRFYSPGNKRKQKSGFKLFHSLLLTEKEGLKNDDSLILVTCSSLMALLFPGFGKFSTSQSGPSDTHLCLILR